MTIPPLGLDNKKSQKNSKDNKDGQTSIDEKLVMGWHTYGPYSVAYAVESTSARECNRRG